MSPRPGRIGGALLPLLAVVLATGLSCDGGNPGGGPSSPSPTGGKRNLVSNGGNFLVLVETVPDPIPLNAPFSVAFSVQHRNPGSGETSASAIGVEVDARMPAHFHGMSRIPKLTHRPDGSYLAEGLLLHMPGHWELYVDITEGARTERAQCDIDLK